MKAKRSLYFRSACIAMVLVMMAGFFVWQIYDAMVAQAIDPEDLTELGASYTTEPIQAARGDITDRYGRVMVTNRAEYAVSLDVDAMGDVDEQVRIVERLMELCREADLEWTDKEFPISEQSPYTYTTKDPYIVLDDETRTLTRTRLYQLCLKQGEKPDQESWATPNTTAPQLVENMSKYFALPAQMKETERRAVLGVLYSAYLRADGVLWTDYYFVEDVDISFITRIKEEGLAGVNIEAIPVREYKTKCAAQLLGQVGAISAEKWEELKEDPENPYQMNDSIGLSGVEAAFEEYLRGEDGTLRTTYDPAGNAISEDYSKAPRPGNTVALTLDSGLQEATERSLAERTEAINTGEGGSAAVVVDMEDSSILAMASYPTFDPADYVKDYKELSKDELKPLYNRALLGTYAPGSTYKISTATAAYLSGVTSLGREIKCTGTMTYYNWSYNCWHAAGHGMDNLAEAVRDSCNIYFYTVGSEMGIDAMNKVAQGYGLGEPTGIELSESLGVNAGPEYSASIGQPWYQGNVLSAAIGQSDNRFTILQLANYIASFLRSGERLDAHLLRSVRSGDDSRLVYEHKSKQMGTVEVTDALRAAIIDGMGQVIAADKITDFESLEDSGIKVGCKTGTAQLGNTGRNNGLFVSFAPIDDPKIAICTVVEKAQSGASTAGITADIMNYYFSAEATLERVEAENQLLR